MELLWCYPEDALEGFDQMHLIVIIEFISMLVPGALGVCQPGSYQTIKPKEVVQALMANPDFFLKPAFYLPQG